MFRESDRSDTKRCGIVVGALDSSGSFAAIEWAAAEAQRRHVPLRLVQAVEINTFAMSGAAWAAVPLITDIDEARAVLDAAVAWIGGLHPGVPVSGHVMRGDPVTVLGAYCERAELLVLGEGHDPHHGWRSAGRSRLIRASSVPVVTVSDAPVGTALDGPLAWGAALVSPQERITVIARSRRGAEDCVGWACARAQRHPAALHVRLVVGKHDRADDRDVVDAEGWLFDLLAQQRRIVGDAVRMSGSVAARIPAQDPLSCGDLVVVSARLGRLKGQLRRIRGLVPTRALAVVPAL